MTEKLIKKIVDEKFESVINGYSSFKVDIFLDSVINDLTEINEKYKIILEEKNKLIEEKNKLIHDKKELEETINELKLIINNKENNINNETENKKETIIDSEEVEK